MGNSLKMADKQRILALLELGWSYRRIQRETDVRRETVARYDPKKVSKPAKVSTGPLANTARVPAGSQSLCEPYRQVIEAAVDKGLSAQRIWQDLKEDYHFSHGYCSVNTESTDEKIKNRTNECRIIEMDTDLYVEGLLLTVLTYSTEF
jgi:hypothetical protein